MSRRIVAVLLCAICCAAGAAAQAVDFRIDTKVHVGDEVHENVTLFQRDVVYDFLSDEGEIAIYDPRTRRFTLLNVQRKVKTTIDERVLLEFVAAIKLRALNAGGRIAREAAQPSFRVAFDGRNLTLTGKRLDYEVRTAQTRFPNAESAGAYFNFIDIYARLNATRRGAMPPHARLELNKQLAERDILPQSVKRTMRSGNPLLGKETVVHSDHIVAWRLLREDQQRIDTAHRHRANFTPVSFGEFRQLEKPDVAAR